MIALVLLGLNISGCTSSASYEKAVNGSTVYLDQLSETQKAEARQKILQSLNAGVADYELGIGDEIEILFHISRQPSSRPYVIAPTDKLAIQFLGDTENSRTVEVLPDGRIFLPLIGSVMAAGKSADALARVLQQRYSRFMAEPKITVGVMLAHTPLDDFIQALGASTKGRSLIATVLPDGTVAMPLLPPVEARGRTLPELASSVNSAYAAKRLDVVVSIVPYKLQSNSALVIGEVNKPGRIELQRPTTVAMAVARAGGALPSGATDAVRLFYIGDGEPRVRSINLDRVLNDFKLEDDMIVPKNSIIYVPPTTLAKTGRLMTVIMRDILRFQGFSIGGGYSIQ